MLLAPSYPFLGSQAIEPDAFRIGVLARSSSTRRRREHAARAGRARVAYTPACLPGRNRSGDAFGAVGIDRRHLDALRLTKYRRRNHALPVGSGDDIEFF